MDVEWVLLCSSALPHADGTVSMLGAGLAQLEASLFPAELTFAVVTRLRLDPADLPASISHRVEFLGAEGDRLAGIEGRYEIPGPATDPSIPVWLNLVQTVAVLAPGAGSQKVVVTVDDLAGTVCPLYLRARPLT